MRRRNSEIKVSLKNDLRQSFSSVAQGKDREPFLQKLPGKPRWLFLIPRLGGREIH